MEEQAVDIADCIAVEDIIENSSSENSLWRFCNSVTLPRSEVVFFTQAALIFIIVVTSLLKIALENHPVKTCHFGWVCYRQQLVTHYQTQNYEQNHSYKRPTLHVSGRTKRLR